VKCPACQNDLSRVRLFASARGRVNCGRCSAPLRSRLPHKAAWFCALLATQAPMVAAFWLPDFAPVLIASSAVLAAVVGVAVLLAFDAVHANEIVIGR
jgi:hypothetical protein